MSDDEGKPLLRHDGMSGRSRGHRSLRSSLERHEEPQDSQTSFLLTSEMKSELKQYLKSCFTLQTVKEKLPIVTWLPKYSLLDAQSDVISGLTVALTVLPQGLAYALIANLPQQYGLYSAFMGVFVYTLLGTSKDITLGPTAIMSLMTAAFATSPVEDDPTFAIVLCLFCGIVQLVMGILHLGIMVNFISYPVINAFTSAAAITIAVGQVKGILGLKDIPREFLHMVYETCKKIPETRIWDLAMGVISLIILFLLKQVRKMKFKPNPNGEPLRLGQKVFRKFIWLIGIGANAIIVITAAGVVAIMHMYGYTSQFSITGYVKPGLPPFKPPSFSVQNGNSTIEAGEILQTIGTGLFIVPLLGLVESIAIGKAFARQNNYRINPTQELLAIGIANIASSFVSAYPVTGSFSRTAVNSQSGVRTPMSGVITGAVIILALQFLTPLFKFIPKSALSAVIISAVIQMVDYEILKKFWKVDKVALIPWVFTFLTSFGVGIEYGILIGIGVQLLLLLYPIARPKITFSKAFAEVVQFPFQPDRQKVIYLDYVVVTFNQAVRFPSVEYLQGKILQNMYEENEKPRSVILDCQHLATGLDYTTIMALIEVITDFKRKNVHFAMASVLPAIQMEMDQAGVKDVIYAPTIEDAVKKIKTAEKAGEYEDELATVTVANGKVTDATGKSGASMPPTSVQELNLGFISDSDEENDDELEKQNSVKL